MINTKSALIYKNQFQYVEQMNTAADLMVGGCAICVMLGASGEKYCMHFSAFPITSFQFSSITSEKIFIAYGIGHEVHTNVGTVFRQKAE